MAVRGAYGVDDPCAFPRVGVQSEISKVQRRIEAMEAKIAAAEREGAFYKKVVDFVHSNPPNDPSHMAHIDKVRVVFVAAHVRRPLAPLCSDPSSCCVRHRCC